MQVIILHGDNIEKSYERLAKFKEEAKKRNWEIIYDNPNPTSSLFANEKLIIIRDYKQSFKSLDKFEGTLVIYHEGVIPATLLKNFPKAKIEKYDLPKLLWKFLDNITLSNFHEIIKTEVIEFVFIMIAWKYKKKYLSSPTPGVGQMIERLAQIDIDVKTGKSDLLTALDLLIIKHIQL